MKHEVWKRGGLPWWRPGENYTTSKEASFFFAGPSRGLIQVLAFFFLMGMAGKPLALGAGAFFPVFNPVIYLGTDPAALPACNCLNNGTAPGNGQFSETISVSGPSGQVWTVTAVSGLYLAGSPAPPASPIPVSTGTVLTETSAGSGLYRLQAIHLDGQGFSVSVSNGTETLSIGNTCYYPNPRIVGLADQYCVTSLPVTLVGNADGATGMGSFRIDGQPATVFNPFALGPGNHVVEYTFNAGIGTPGDPNDPGCSLTARQTVLIHPEPNLVTNFQVNVPLGYDCEALIVPDMILEGEYPCLNEDYYVTIFDLQGQPIGNTVTGEYVGQILPVQVSSLAGGYTGFGSILVLDGLGPQITDCSGNNGMGTVMRNVQIIRDTLKSTDPTFYPGNFSCLADQINTPGNLHYYKTDTFSVTRADIYTLELSAAFGRGAALLFQGPFNLFTGPCQNFMAMPFLLDPGQGFFTGQSQTVRLVVPLQPGQIYTLLTTSADPQQTGPFAWAVYAAGDGRVRGLPVQLAPVALDLFCDDYLQILNNPASLALTGTPEVDDNCGPPQITFSDQLLANPACGDVVIRRTFTATDVASNEAQCVQEIRLMQLSVRDAVLPPKNIIIECDVEFPVKPNGNPTPEVSGYPLVQTAFGIHPLNPRYCNLLASHNDQPRVNLCNGSYRFTRRWYILDDCNPSATITYDQVVQVLDRTPPLVQCPNPDLDLNGQPDTLFFSAGSSSCAASFQVPMPVVSDNCSGWQVLTEVVTGQSPAQVLATIPHGAGRQVSGIPVGCHRFRYTVTDDCGNRMVIECPFCVVDLVSPVAVCDDDLTVALNNNGYGAVAAVDVDEGSTDNCGMAKMEVRRMIDRDPDTCTPVTPYFTDWAPTVEFNCCEVGMMIPVELRVTDIYGNTNTCVTEILVADNIRPGCIAPNPVSLFCYELPAAFNPDSIPQLSTLFGIPQASDNCPGASIRELSPVNEFDNCGAGTIIRRFMASDANGNSSAVCQQLITIREGFKYKIKFPKDAIAICEVPNPDTLEIISQGCDRFAVNVEDEIFSTSDASCYKIQRTYKIFNWCEYNGFADPVVIDRNEDCDNEGGEENTWVIVQPGIAYTDRDSDPLNSNPPAGARGTSCTGGANPQGYWRTVQSTGYWMYKQMIKVYDTTEPDIEFTPPAPFCSNSNQTCSGPVSIDFSVTETCSANQVVVRVFLDMNADGTPEQEVTNQVLSGSFPNYRLSGTYPIGTHAFQVRVRDGCENTNQATIPFSVIDCLAPAPTCRSGIAVELAALEPGVDADGDGIPDPAARVVLATELLSGSPLNDCSGNIRFSIHRVADITAGTDVPTPSHEALVLTCRDVGAVPVRIYAWDQAVNPNRQQPDGSLGGPNYGFCEATIIVQDGNALCTSNITMEGSIAGTIFTEEEEPLAGVKMNPGPQMPLMMTTGPDGRYRLDQLEMGHDYTIVPHLDGDYDNGVSTLDLILINKHILGNQPLNSPYKLIAADVNRSGSVTTLDVIQLRKLVLGLTEAFPNNTSWRFIDATFVFPHPEDPWSEDFPEEIRVTDLHEDMAGQDFIAVKVGDVNGNARTQLQETAQERSSPPEVCYIQTTETELVAGRWYTIDFKTTATATIAGFQFTLDLATDALEVSGLLYGLIREDQMGLLHLDRGRITVSWDLTDPGWVLPEEVGTETLFGLRVKALKNGRLSEFMQVSSSITTAEAYTDTGDLMGLALQFTGQAPAEQAFQLLQNRPNPFFDQTVIGFFMAEEQDVVLTIFDNAGKVVFLQEERYPAGYHQIPIQASILPASGLLYYRLETPTHSATRKMILVKK